MLVAGLVCGCRRESEGEDRPALAGFAVLETKVSPARIRFVLFDHEGQPATVELLARVGAGPDQRLTRISGLASNPASLAASRAGTAYDFPWDFSAESFLPDDGSFVEDVTVFAALAGAKQGIVPGTPP